MATQASDTASNTAKRARGASPDELAVIAQRAQAFTNASGVAIALSEGNADEIICRARSGASAPDVGAALRVEGTFTGLCIQSGKELRCDDCETDTRVDTAAIRALNIRSMVVTPVREDNRVIGVLAVFAPTPHAFTITHVAVLKTMSDQISALLQRDRRAREEGQTVEAVRAPAPVQTSKPAAVPPVQMAPSPVVIKPAPAAPPRAAAPPPVSLAPRAEAVKIAAPMEVVPLATPPKAEKRLDTSTRSSFGTFDSVAAEDKKPGNRFMMLGAVTVLLIAAAATFVFLKMQKGGTTAAQHPQQESAANVPPPAASALPTGQPAPPAATANQPAPGVIVPNGAGAVSAKPSPEDKSQKPARNERAAGGTSEKPTPAEKPTLVATVASNQQSKISQAANTAPDAAPSFTVLNSGDSPAPLSNLARPVGSATPSAAAIEQSQLEPLQLIRSAGAVYPAIAKARHLSGPVVVEVKVGKDGKVSNPKFISGLPIFKDAAFDAVMKYQFKAAKLNGQPIEQTTQIKLIFRE